MSRFFRSFSYKGANFKIASDKFDVIVEEIIVQRDILSRYIKIHPGFLSSFVPVKLKKGAPEIAVLMSRAADKTGTGPMAAVAGINAQLACEAAVREGAKEAIIENGGDIYIFARSEVKIALYAGEDSPVNNLAIVIKPERTPVSICSSSAKMGHSASLGDCDLATVVSPDGALADAAATQACNMVKTVDDIENALNFISGIEGITGLLIVKNGKIGIAGNFPPIVKNKDLSTLLKITKDRSLLHD